MSAYQPVAIAHRDGFGHAFEVAVAARLRQPVLVLGPSGAIVGECTADGIISWDPLPRLHGGRVAPAAVRRALASSGRLSAAVSESGDVLALRAEYKSGSP